MASEYYIGLMSGTSLDGVDAALIIISDDHSISTVATAFLPFEEALTQSLRTLNQPGHNEIELSQRAAIVLSRLYADAVHQVISTAGLTASDIAAIGCHGQTIRHRPDLGFTVQISNPALLAELTSISVVSDFRSRDIAAGGQGAPLVPAFHQAIFGHPTIPRIIVNIGGFSNLSVLVPNQPILGFDCGPGNALINDWIQLHLGASYDRDGQWASQGTVIPELLGSLQQHPFFRLLPPKSTGRDDFNLAWASPFLNNAYSPVDVQTTLTEFSAWSIAVSIREFSQDCSEIYLCGGGAYNLHLVSRLRAYLPEHDIFSTERLGIAPDWVESMAFAWLAYQTLHGKPGNLPSVTGAQGPRILGAIYPA
jgi:anhydro-N-acetylmuramic acid kinase